MSLRHRARTVVMIAATAVAAAAVGLAVMDGAQAVQGPAPTAAAPTAPAAPTGAAVQAKATTTATTAPTTHRLTQAPVTVSPTKATIKPTLSLRTITPTVTAAQQYRAVFRLVMTQGSTPISGMHVMFWRQDAGSKGWVPVNATGDITDDKGKITFVATQTAASASYKATFVGRAPYQAATSGLVTVKKK